MSEEKETKFEGWAILELMGHRRLGGYVVETQLAGAGFLRIDIPGADSEPAITQFYPPQSLYGLTPVTEAMARAVAARNVPQPVARWELPAAAPPEHPSGDNDVSLTREEQEAIDREQDMLDGDEEL